MNDASHHAHHGHHRASQNKTSNNGESEIFPQIDFHGGHGGSHASYFNIEQPFRVLFESWDVKSDKDLGKE